MSRSTKGRLFPASTRSHVGVAVAALLLSAVASPVAEGGGGVEVRLEARRGVVPQGLPVAFSAELTNRSARSQVVGISFDLVKPRGELPPIPFHRYVTSLSARETQVLRLSVVPAQWFSGRGTFRILTRSGEAPPEALSFRVVKPPVRLPRFEEVSAAVGAPTLHRGEEITCDALAAGAAWGDIEGDGDLDLFLAQQKGSSQLFVQEAGRFTEDAAARGVDAPGVVATGAVFADYDNDGDQDLYVVSYHEDRLFRNGGDGRFTDVTASAGIAESNPGSSAAWGDYDRDGFLDLYVANWGKESEVCRGNLTYFPDTLYHNQGDGTFTEVTGLLGPPETTRGAGFQAAWLDYDLDGDDDLYLGNDYVGASPRANVLWRNDGSDEAGGWRFTNVSAESGANLAINTMGLAPGDYDRDGDLDIAFSNVYATKLLRNEGNGTFSEVARAAGVGRPEQRVSQASITWGMGFYDLNNDGWEDLFVAAGSLPLGYADDEQPDELFANLGKGRFADLSAPSGIADPEWGRGVAFGDYDRDGRMDMYVVNRLGAPRLYRNITKTKDAHWLQLDLTGTRSNRDGCGALVTLRIPKTRPMVRELFCGSVSLASGNEAIVHFGLGEERRVKTLTIRWPSGTEQVLRNVRADQRLIVQEPA